MAEPPSTGLLTFLFTDVEGSTKLWEENGETMPAALAAHDKVIRQAIESHGGQVFKTVGDAFYAVFFKPSDAVEAAVAAQRGLSEVDFSMLPRPICIRVALHTGAADARDNDYFGNTLNRLARIVSVGHGGQVLLSSATNALCASELPADASVRSLGAKRLKDLAGPEEIFQLIHPDLQDDFPTLRSLDHLPNNLPQQVTQFIGREAEISEMKALLQGTRLLTLVGTGGAGKTRLSLQVAAEVLEFYTQGVWFVELAALAEPEMVAPALAAVLQIGAHADANIEASLIEHLKTGRRLILLDNCEHLLDACASLCSALMRSCPELSILASSREGLGIAGEQTYRVKSLSVPVDEHPTASLLDGYEAVTLFVDRATLANQSFELTDQNAAGVASVCRRLDGIPLAIELAAARVRSISVEQLAARLDDRFRILTGGSRTALPRQQTLRALIDWSYDLLSEPERTLLQRLSVFAGGWSLEAAEAVCTGDPIEDWEVLDLLTGIADKSLVIFDGGRYSFLETIRQYSREKLMESGAGAEVRDGHRDWFQRLAAEAAVQLHGPDRGEWRDRLLVDQENLWTALEWAKSGDVGPGELGHALGVMLHRRGRSYEAIKAIDEGLASNPQESDLLARLLYERGGLHSEFGNHAEAQTMVERALELFTEDGDFGGVARSENVLGQIAMGRSEHTRAAELYDRSLEAFRKVGDEIGVSTVLNNQALNARRDRSGSGGDRAARLGQAEEWLRASLEIRTTRKDLHGVAEALINLGVVAFELEDYDRAWDYYLRALGYERELGHLSGIAVALANLGEVAELRGEKNSAGRLFAVSERLLIEVQSPLAASVAKMLDTALAEDAKMVRAAARSQSQESAIDWALGA